MAPLTTVSVTVEVTAINGDGTKDTVASDAILQNAGVSPQSAKLPTGKVTFDAPEEVTLGDGSVWVCKGWIGTGDIISADGSCSVPVFLTSVSTITWKYEKQTATRVSFRFSASGVDYSKSEFALFKQSAKAGDWDAIDMNLTMRSNPFWYGFDTDTTLKLTAKAMVKVTDESQKVTTYTCTDLSATNSTKLQYTSILNGNNKEFAFTLNNDTTQDTNLDVAISYKVATQVNLGTEIKLKSGCTVTLETPGNQTDTLENAFYRPGATGDSIYPVRPISLFTVTCKNSDPKTTDPETTDYYYATWGDSVGPNVVAGAPINLQDGTPSYTLAETGHYSESYDNNQFTYKQADNTVFLPTKAGRTLLRFTGPDNNPDFVTVTATVNPTPTVGSNCNIGATITPPIGTADKKPGFVLRSKAYYDADVYTSDDVIIPVNIKSSQPTDAAKATDFDLDVAWYTKNTTTTNTTAKDEIAWPLVNNFTRYTCGWPTPGDNYKYKISVPGPGFALEGDQKAGSIYNQPDNTKPGFNPNEEHAFMQGGQLFALRTDLNKADSSATWVLLKYKSNGKWAMQPYQVVEDKTYTQAVSAGKPILPPSPLSFLPQTTASLHSAKDTAGNAWYFKDHKGGHWAKASDGTNKTSTSKIIMQWYYPLQPGFYYSHIDSSIKIGDPIPFQNGGNKHTDLPTPITYNVSWPDTVPTLSIGETLTTTKNGLPAVSAMAAVKQIYGNESALLFAPYEERSIPLEAVPDVKKELHGDRYAFTELPYALRSRLFYDTTAKKLIFLGRSIEAVTGEPLLLPNIMSSKDKDSIAASYPNSVLTGAVGDLYKLTNAPLLGAASGIPQALSAGYAQNSGYVVLAENDDVALGSAPVTLHVIYVNGGPYQGEIRVIKSDNPFDEKLTLRHTGDFAGNTDNVYFSWYYQPDNGTQPKLPAKNDTSGWTLYKTGTGLNEITIEGADKLTLEDNWFMVRYYYGDDPATTKSDAVFPSLADALLVPSTAKTIPDVTNNWSAWAGAPGGATAQLAEGWIKRVTNDLNPLDARVADFRNNASNTTVSMLTQLGSRYSGAVALNGFAENLNSIGLIEAYQTVLNRGVDISGINTTKPIDSPAANTALLNAATRIADFYTLLGNEAYNDALDPTVGYDTRSGQSGTMASSIFAFQNQVDSLLEEELELLRGRDNVANTTQAYPVYNRLLWNFTNGDGETAYVQTYNISDRNMDGFINEADAKIMYPQGHGDAWGHYLTAMTTWYGLLKNANYTWLPRNESIMVGNSPVTVDYLDERKFARTAAYKAQTGAEIVDRTFRKLYVHDPAGQYLGYKDSVLIPPVTGTPRAWGVDEWARRAGQGAYFDWVMANALLPSVDPDATHTGIAKIDRTTVPELKEITSHFLSIQFKVDQADSGYNPIGLASGVVPFDIEPSLVITTTGRDAQTHFEQIYGRAVKSLENARTVYDYATQYSQFLRGNEDSLDSFRKQVVNQERSYQNQLIEIFGYPYAGDIGSGKTYPAGYEGPDLFHYMYMNVPELSGVRDLSNTITKKVTFNMKGDNILSLDIEGGTPTTVPETLDVSYPISTEMPWNFSIPDDWLTRRAPGEIQMALQDLIRAQAFYDKSLETYKITLNEIEAKTKLLEAVYDVKADQIRMESSAHNAVTGFESVALVAKELKNVFEHASVNIHDTFNVVLEAIPKIVGAAIDPSPGVRSTITAAQSKEKIIFENATHVTEYITLMTEFIANQAERSYNLQISKDEARKEVLEMATELEIKAEEILPMIPDMFAQQASVQEALGRYQAALAKGVRLLDEREVYRKQTAGDIQDYRYQDLAFRTFRNDAVQKYRSSFSLASRYAYLAAAAYDYELNLFGPDRTAGASFFPEIARQLSPGVITNGVPMAGAGGLADPLARLNQNFSVYKTQLGFNNPQMETTPFSLRKELFRIMPDTTSDVDWRKELERYTVDDLNKNKEFVRYCRPFTDNTSTPQPGLVIPFSTEVRFGHNFFGFPLGSGDSSYDPSRFATKIRSVGLWFTGYNNAKLSATPRAYLVPVGTDVLRSPSGNGFLERHWQVVDQKLPVPFPITSDEIAYAKYFSVYNTTVHEMVGGIRRFSSIRAYNDDSSVTGTAAAKLAEMNTDSGLVGRSVWNTQWLLIIPGGYLLDDPAAGVDNFINNVSDIRLFFQTYSYSGN